MSKRSIMQASKSFTQSQGESEATDYKYRLVFYLICKRKSGILQILIIKERYQLPE